MSNGLLDTVEGVVGPSRDPDGPLAEVGVMGVSDRVARRELSRAETIGAGDRRSRSPRRTRDSTARSRFPSTPFSAVRFRWLSEKPMSRS
jgi:hypothetical protein